MHRQCVLRRGTTQQTAWIPAAQAVVGKHVRLKAESGWEDGWEVLSAGEARPTELVLGHASDYRNQRAASDI